MWMSQQRHLTSQSQGEKVIPSWNNPNEESLTRNEENTKPEAATNSNPSQVRKNTE